VEESTSPPHGSTAQSQKHSCRPPQLLACVVKQRLHACHSPSPRRGTFPAPAETPRLWQQAGRTGEEGSAPDGFLPNERVPISKRQRGDGTEVAVQHGNALAGAQVPDADLVVH